ncbi:MAG: F0F1 ATP synthase subunit A [Clostridiales Family XIII bacterium]|jgi:F-type H+-transporting ATPase subunit a|nr:F0F1 ATP synthase subunit A [Clostridiales Family XIII bacterium]
MHDLTNLGPRIILKFSDKFYITETAVWGFIFAVVLAVLLLWLGSGLKKIPGRKQVVAEFIVQLVYNFTKNTMGKENLAYAPYVGTIILWIALSNMAGMFGVRPPTTDINMTFALGSVTFILIQRAAIKSAGIKGYIAHFAEPYPFMVPVKIIEEFTFPISLSLRLFGNILGGYIIVTLFMNLMSWLSESLLRLPIPIFEVATPLPLNAFFDIFEPLLQSFIFTILTMAFISKAIISKGEKH